MVKHLKFELMVVLITLASHYTFASDLKIELEKIKSPSVKYSKHTDLSSFPIPIVSFKRGGLASGAQELNEIIERIIYPIINESPDPISAMIVEFFPHLPGQVGIEVYWTNGGMRGALIDRSTDGHYDVGAYKTFFKKPTP